MSCVEKGEKPEFCITCTESLHEEPNSLPCGHWIHIACIEKQFKAECPLCRLPLNMEVYGSHPTPFIPYDTEDFDDRILGIILFGQNMGIEVHRLEEIFNDNVNNNEQNEEQNNQVQISDYLRELEDLGEVEDILDREENEEEKSESEEENEEEDDEQYNSNKRIRLE